MKTIKVGIIIFALLAIPVIFTGCDGNGEETVQEIPPVPVMTAKPHVGNMTKWYRTTCDLQSPLESRLSFPNGGRIIELVVREGDTVVAGQYLGSVDTSQLRANLSAIYSSVESVRKQAEAADAAALAAGSSVDIAQASYDQAQRDFERYELLYEDGVATLSEFERMQLNVDTSRISLEGAREQVVSAQAQAVAVHASVQSVRDSAAQVQVMINDGTLRAPYGGRIAQVFYDPGVVVGPGTPVYKILGDGNDTGDRLEVRLTIPEVMIERVSVGSPLYIDLASCESEIQVPIDHLGAEVAEASRTIEAVAFLERNSDCFMPGMFGSVKIPLEIHENTVIIPESALLETEEYKIVYIVNGNTAVRKDVEIGIREEGMVEIISGLNSDDDVIVVGNAFLKDGATIEIRDETIVIETGDEPEMEEES